MPDGHSDGETTVYEWSWHYRQPPSWTHKLSVDGDLRFSIEAGGEFETTARAGQADWRIVDYAGVLRLFPVDSDEPAVTMIRRFFRPATITWPDGTTAVMRRSLWWTPVGNGFVQFEQNESPLMSVHEKAFAVRRKRLQISVIETNLDTHRRALLALIAFFENVRDFHRR